ncbi:MAG: MFS transporter [Planctomycetes bacterium]|nr:MFS transporter [Planctomycetota bacterium]
MTSPPSPRSRLPAIVYALGLVSFFTDLASEMIVPLLPAFLDDLGGSAVQLGVLVGISELIVAALRLLSGALSDRMRRRKPWVVGGYALSSLVRPLFALVQTPWQAIAVRSGDRIGKGLRSPPRDALIAGVVDPRHRGRAFGVEMRTLFALALAPGLAAVLVLWLFVRENGVAQAVADPTAAGGSSDGVRRLLPFLAVVAFAAVSASIDLFAIRRALDLGCAVAQLPLLWVLLHVVRSLFAGRFGSLSDRLGRRGVMTVGLGVHAVVLGGFAVADSAVWMWPLFTLLGLHAALTEGAERGYVADLTGASKHGAAFGVYYTVHGLAAFAGSYAIGAAWDGLGAAAGFGTAAGAAVMAMVLLAIVGRHGPRRGA